MIPELVSLDWLVLAPVLAPAFGALLVLIVDALAPRARGLHLPIGLAALGAGLGALPFGASSAIPARTLCGPAPDARCFYEVAPWGLGLQLLALSGALVVLLLLGPGTSHLDRAQRGGPAVTVALVLAATAGTVMLPAARDLPAWLIAVELATLPAIAMVALSRGRSAEGGALSLLLVSLTSFGFLAVGVALWVVATGDATFAGVSLQAAFERTETHRVLLLAILFLLAGLGFKLSAVPFHTWTPQAFVAADEPVAGYLATVSKAAALGATIVVLAPLVTITSIGSDDGDSVRLVIGVLALASMTLGNLVALRADDPVRLLAWSTIAQAGWVLAPLAMLTPRGVASSVGYLLVYAVGTLAVFTVAAAVHTASEGSGERSLTAYTALARRNPGLALLLGLGLLTLAGLPPAVIGVVAKIVALQPVVEAGQWWLVAAMVINVVLGIAVYLRWLLVMVRPGGTDPGPRLRLDPGLVVAALLLGALTLVLSIAPGLVIDLVR